MLRVLTVKIEEKLLNEIDKRARELGYRSRSEFVREALEFYLRITDVRAKKYNDHVESLILFG